MPKSKKLIHVALLIESSRGYGRQIIAAVARYAREKANWALYFEPHGLEAATPWIKDWEGDGIIARVYSPDQVAQLQKKDIPIVDLSGALSPSRLPVVASDNQAVAEIAFDCLEKRGFRRFGFFGSRSGMFPYIEERGDYFRKLVAAKGYPFSICSAETEGVHVRNWEAERTKVAEWLATLEKPVGIYAGFDELGWNLLAFCAREGIRVPEEIAVVSTGNDAVLCETSFPPMTSVIPDAQRIGHEAAILLDRMLAGRKSPQRPIRIAPLGLAERHSTDIVAIDDAEVALALQYIRDNACSGSRVSDLLVQVGTSYKLLERRFRALIGRTPKAEMLRIQISRARRLLAESDFTIKHIAQQCGFSTEKYFSDVFLEKTGCRPGAYRKSHHRELEDF